MYKRLQLRDGDDDDLDLKRFWLVAFYSDIMILMMMMISYLGSKGFLAGSHRRLIKSEEKSRCGAETKSVQW